MSPDNTALLYRFLIPSLWLAWAVYWLATSQAVKTTVRRESGLSRLMHLGPLVVAAALLWIDRTGVGWLDARFLPWAPWCFPVGAALTLAGLLFAVWARRHIGANWSATVTLKRDHALVTSGPYALVRHPIYTGLLMGFVGSAISRGEWRGVLAVVIVYLALWRKYRLEERWMHERFGAVYDDYRRRVKALVPFVF